MSNHFSFKNDVISGFGVFKFDASNTDVSYALADNDGVCEFFKKEYSIKIDFDVDNDRLTVNQNTNKEKLICDRVYFYQKLGWQLGFREKSITIDNTIDTNGTGMYSIASRSICSISYPRYIYIAIDDFQSSSRNYFSIASDSIIAPNIIGRINILNLLEEKTGFKQAGAPGDFIYNQKHVREYFGPTDITKLRISLLDEYGRKLSLNNMDWSFILSFECFYN